MDLMGHGRINPIRSMGGGSGGVVIAVSELAHFPHDGARQVVYRKTRIYRSELDDPRKVKAIGEIQERLRRKRLAEGDPWPAMEPVAS